MDESQEYALKLSRANKDEKVKFVFETTDGKSKVVQSLKSVLITKSPAFKAMFSETWDKGKVRMDDAVTFDQEDTFSRFLLLLADVMRPQQLTIPVACSCYFYADKYRVNGLMTDILDAITRHWSAFSLDDIKNCLALTETYSLVDFKTKLNTVKLNLNQGNAIEFYEVCEKYQMDGLINQLIKHLQRFPVDKSWPQDLVLKIMDQERMETRKNINKAIADIKRLSDQLHDFQMRYDDD